MKKRILNVALVVALMLGTLSAAYAATDNEQTAGSTDNASVQAGQVKFKDLAGFEWADKAINTMAEKDIITGYTDGSFKPQNTVTYAEFIKMAVVAATGEDVGKAPSTDEKGIKQHWAMNYYKEGLDHKYFGQTDISEYQLDNQIPRRDMALLISNILGEVKIDKYSQLEERLKDVDSTIENDYDIIKSYAFGIISGYNDGTFKPEKTLNRAEAASVIYRLIDESERVIPNLEEEEEDIKEKEEPAEEVTEPKEEMVTIGFHGWDKTLERKLVRCNLGDYGIAKFEITDLGYVAIYSTVRYDYIELVIDNKIIDGFCNPNGTEYWEIDGYYVYFAEPAKNGVDVTGKVPTLLGLVKDSAIMLTDVTL